MDFGVSQRLGHATGRCASNTPNRRFFRHSVPLPFEERNRNPSSRLILDGSRLGHQPRLERVVRADSVPVVPSGDEQDVRVLVLR